jgi:threonine aldolase
MIPGLSDDHRRARLLAEGLARIRGVNVGPSTVQTNIVVADLVPELGTSSGFIARLSRLGVGALALSGQRIRLVTHAGIDDENLARAIALIEDATRSTEG